MVNIILSSLKKFLCVENLSEKEIISIIQKLEGIGCGWRNLGDIEANYGRVHIAGSGAHTLIERVTNSIDAELEKHATEKKDLLNMSNPREAVSKIYNIKEGYLVNLKEEMRQKIAKESGVEIFVKPKESRVNVVFRDKGIGLTREEMPKTILSLNESNKFRKRFLMGQYGQGGSTTCAFSEFTLIISRKLKTKNVSFTIIRFNDLKEDLEAKDGKYEYLVDKDELPLSIEVKDDIGFGIGTLVMHINHNANLQQGFINYYNLFDQILFDPPLPYALYYDKWAPGSKRILSGVRRRLQGGDNTKKWMEYTYQFPRNPEYGKLSIRWFLLEPFKIIKGIKRIIKIKDILYEDSHPILITYNGQVQGKLRKNIIKDRCRLGYIYNSLIVQIECDNLTSQGKKFLFTTSRDRITEEGASLIEDSLITILSGDEYLTGENEERENQSISERVTKTTKQMRSKLAEMLNRLDPGKFGLMIAKHSGKGVAEKGKKKAIKGKREDLPPLPTKQEPSFLKIVNKADPLKISIGGTTRLQLESDAPDGVLGRSWNLKIPSSLANKIKIHSTSNFFGGRGICIIKLEENVKIGEKFKICLELERFTEKKITSNKREILVTERKISKKDAEFNINAPNVEEVYEGHVFYDQENWGEDNVAEVKRGSEITIYVSTSNKWLQSTLKNTNYAEPKKRRLKSDYILYVAFHAFLQDEFLKETSISGGDEEKDLLKEKELERIARTLIVSLTSSSAFEEN